MCYPFKQGPKADLRFVTPSNSGPIVDIRFVSPSNSGPKADLRFVTLSNSRPKADRLVSPLNVMTKSGYYISYPLNSGPIANIRMFSP